jgi:hypothetical protein
VPQPSNPKPSPNHHQPYNEHWERACNEHWERATEARRTLQRPRITPEARDRIAVRTDEFGDVTKKVVSSFTGKEEYQFGDVRGSG